MSCCGGCDYAPCCPKPHRKRKGGGGEEEEEERGLKRRQNFKQLFPGEGAVDKKMLSKTERALHSDGEEDRGGSGDERQTADKPRTGKEKKKQIQDQVQSPKT